jgi:DNA repair protein RadC
MTAKPLSVRDANGPFVPAENAVVVKVARSYSSRRLHRATALTNPRGVRDCPAVTLGERACKYSCLALVDTRHRLIDSVNLFRGTIDGASGRSREVAHTALAKSAAAVRLVHNHPRGVGEASEANANITPRLRDALAVVHIRTVDHLVAAGGTMVSLANSGLR